MKLIHGLVFDENGDFTEKEIDISGEKISETSDDDTVIDASGLYVIPAFMDIHFHGAMNADFSDGTESSLQTLCDYEERHGIVNIVPATMTLPKEEIQQAMETAGKHKNTEGATLLGINMEGPYISEKKLGAQNPEYVKTATVSEFEKLQEASSHLIRVVDLAPEKEENLEFIRAMKGKVHLSLAHTICDYDCAKLAFEAGADHLTHMFDAMNQMDHRQPGPILAAYEHNAYVELIADGIHVHPAMVRLAFDMFRDHVCLISDSMRATGLPDGEYTLGGLSVTKMGNKAVLSEHRDTIAGSVTDLYDCFRNAVLNMKVPLSEAIKACSINPARSLSLDQEYGSITIGKYADILLVDHDLNLRKVIHKGKIID